MSTIEKKLRVLIVDDNRDGADALGLLVEELGNKVHVTYSGTQALEVAMVFRADLLLVDLVMPVMDGCLLAQTIRQMPIFAQTQLVAVTGYSDAEHAALAMKAGFSQLLVKPVSLSAIKTVLDNVSASVSIPTPKAVHSKPVRQDNGRLPISEARRLRSERASKTLTQTESESAISEGVVRFQEEYLGRSSKQIHCHFIKDMVVVRILGTMTHAELQLGKSAGEKGRDLIKQVRRQLLELGRSMLESLVHEVVGVKVLSMHHDISTVTGEEVVLFSLAETPRFA